MIAQFALRLICGLSLMWAVMPRREVTSGFFRIQMLVTLGLSVLAAMAFVGFSEADDAAGSLLDPSGSRWAAVAIAVLSFCGSVAWTIERRAAGTAVAMLIAATSLVAVVLSRVAVDAAGTPIDALRPLSAVATSAVLGGAVGGMLLGHWYLTAPTMSIDPLRKLSLWLGAAAVLRLLVSAVVLTLEGAALSGLTVWLWLSLRWLAGIAGPIAVTIMTIRILRYRNTQAATGVLFVGVILTFIGETAAALLEKELSLPL